MAFPISPGTQTSPRRRPETRLTNLHTLANNVPNLRRLGGLDGWLRGLARMVIRGAGVTVLEPCQHCVNVTLICARSICQRVAFRFWPGLLFGSMELVAVQHFGHKHNNKHTDMDTHTATNRSLHTQRSTEKNPGS